MVWATSIRPDPNCGKSCYDCYAYYSQPNVPHASRADVAPTPAVTQSAFQPVVPAGGSSGPPKPSVPTVQPVVPSKRPLEQEQQTVAPAPSARLVQPALPNLVSPSSLTCLRNASRKGLYVVYNNIHYGLLCGIQPSTSPRCPEGTTNIVLERQHNSSSAYSQAPGPVIAKYVGGGERYSK